MFRSWSQIGTEGFRSAKNACRLQLRTKGFFLVIFVYLVTRRNFFRLFDNCLPLKAFGTLHLCTPPGETFFDLLCPGYTAAFLSSKWKDRLLYFPVICAFILQLHVMRCIFHESVLYSEFHLGSSVGYIKIWQYGCHATIGDRQTTFLLCNSYFLLKDFSMAALIRSVG